MYMYNNIYCNVTTQSRERKKINDIIHVDTYKYINTIMAYDHGNMKVYIYFFPFTTDKKVNVRTQILKRVKLVRYGLLSSIYRGIICVTSFSIICPLYMVVFHFISYLLPDIRI